MSELLAEHHRKAAHSKHRCHLCYRPIKAGENYLDQRTAQDGTVYTLRTHYACTDAYWSHEVDPDEPLEFIELCEGHLPPCRLAWYGTDGDCDCEDEAS